MCSPWYIGGFPKIQPKLTLSQKKNYALFRQMHNFFWESVNFVDGSKEDPKKFNVTSAMRHQICVMRHVHHEEPLTRPNSSVAYVKKKVPVGPRRRSPGGLA